MGRGAGSMVSTLTFISCAARGESFPCPAQGGPLGNEKTGLDRGGPYPVAWNPRSVGSYKVAYGGGGKDYMIK